MADVDQTPAEVSTDQIVAEVEANAPESYFYEFETGGNKLAFKTPEELSQHLSKSINFESDYTRKSQAREAEYRKKMEEVESKRKEYETQREKWEREEKAKYDKYNEALQRRPAIARELERLATTPATPDEAFQRTQSYADQKYAELKAELDKVNARYEAEQMEKQTEAIYAELEQRYPDFNRDVVKKALGDLDGNDPKALVEMLWKASRGDPAQIQEKVERNIAKKAGAGMLPSGGGSPPKKTGPMSDKQAYEDALRDYAGVGG